MFSGEKAGVAERAKRAAAMARRVMAKKGRKERGMMGFWWERVWALALRYQPMPFDRSMGPKKTRRDLILLVL